eukprot:516161-Prymnesium_polylepis.1
MVSWLLPIIIGAVPSRALAVEETCQDHMTAAELITLTVVREQAAVEATQLLGRSNRSLVALGHAEDKLVIVRVVHGIFVDLVDCLASNCRENARNSDLSESVLCYQRTHISLQVEYGRAAAREQRPVPLAVEPANEGSVSTVVVLLLLRWHKLDPARHGRLRLRHPYLP